MFFRITGSLWIMLGIWWIMRPNNLKRRFTKKLKRSRRKVLFFAIIVMSSVFFSAARYAQGIVANIFLIIGALTILKAIFFFTSKGAGKAIEWWLKKPLWVWRLWAGGFVLIGLLLQMV